MSSVALLIFFMLGLLILSAALFVFSAARGQERREQILKRSRIKDQVAADDWTELNHNLADIDPITAIVIRQFWRSGFRLSVIRARTCLAVLGLMFLLLLLIGHPISACILLLGVPFILQFVLRYFQSKRRLAISRQLPEFLEGVLRAIASGNTLEMAFAGANEETPEPLHSLIASVVRQLNLGATLDEVLGNAAEVNGIEHLHTIALAARVNRQYGGGLRRLLRGVVATVRRGERSERELKALTGETRVSAGVLIGVPVLIVAFVLFRNPGYYAQMWQHTGGRLMLFAVVILQMVGIFLIWRMMTSARRM